jgi:hypothetical protein
VRVLVPPAADTFRNRVPADRGCRSSATPNPSKSNRHSPSRIFEPKVVRHQTLSASWAPRPGPFYIVQGRGVIGRVFGQTAKALLRL